MSDRGVFCKQGRLDSDSELMDANRLSQQTVWINSCRQTAESQPFNPTWVQLNPPSSEWPICSRGFGALTAAAAAAAAAGGEEEIVQVVYRACGTDLRPLMPISKSRSSTAPQSAWLPSNVIAFCHFCAPWNTTWSRFGWGVSVEGLGPLHRYLINRSSN